MPVAANKISQSQHSPLFSARSDTSGSVRIPFVSIGNQRLGRLLRNSERDLEVESTPPRTPHTVALAKKAISGPGLQLPQQVQQEAGLLYGDNFADVRLHTGTDAAAAAGVLHASAFTLGRDIAFGAHRYAPGTARGRLLLHHELRHVAQQRSAPPAAVPKVGSPDSASELDAHEVLNSRTQRLSVQEIQCAPEGEEFSLGTGLIDKIGSGTVGERAWPFMKALLEGFVGGLSADVKSGRAKSAKAHLAELLVPWNLTKYFGGYLVGLVIGLVSPITDLVKGVVGIVQLAISALEWLAKWSPVGIAISQERQLKVARLTEKFRELGNEFVKALAEFRADPKGTIQKFAGFLDDLMQKALGKAREMGANAAHAVFNFLELPFYEMGKSIGEVVGALIAQVLLLVFTDAIGNIIAKGASFLGKAAEFVAGKAVQVFEWVKGFVSEVFAVLRNAIKGALKLFAGLIEKAGEAFEALSALFGEAASVELAGERVAAGVGRQIPGKGTNIMESRMISGGRTAPAKVSDLTPPKVHPSNVGKEVAESRKVSEVAKQSVALEYRDNLVKRFPKLKDAELQPIKRALGEPGLWEESVYTGSGERSWLAKMQKMVRW